MACHNNLAEVVGRSDALDEGLVARQDLKEALERQKISGLTADELSGLLKACDRGHKGYLATGKFIELLYGWAGESEGEVLMRRLGKSVAHSKTNLRRELEKVQTDSSGTLDKTAVKKALKQLAIALTDAEILKLIAAQNEGGPPPDRIDIKAFAARVTEAAGAKPLPNYILQGPRGGSSTGARGGGANPMAAFEAEKKYKKNLEALKQEIEERNREIQGLKGEVKDCHDRYNRLDLERKHLEARLVDKHAKPPRETHNEALAFSQGQELMQLRDQLAYQQAENTKLRRTIEVQLKAEVSRLSTEKDQLEEKLRDSQDERSRLQHQINSLVGKPMDALEQREELELTR